MRSAGPSSRYVSTSITRVAGRTPSYLMASPPFADWMAAWKAAMSGTSKSTPARFGLSGSRNVRWVMPRGSKSSLRFGDASQWVLSSTSWYGITVVIVISRWLETCSLGFVLRLPLGQDRVQVDGRLLRRRLEAALDPCLHPRHEDVVAEPLPALLRVVDRQDRPSTGRRPCGVVDLPGRQPIGAGVHRGDRSLVLVLGAAREVVNDSVRHGRLRSSRAPRPGKSRGGADGRGRRRKPWCGTAIRVLVTSFGR